MNCLHATKLNQTIISNKTVDGWDRMYAGNKTKQNKARKYPFYAFNWSVSVDGKSNRTKVRVGEVNKDCKLFIFLFFSFFWLHKKVIHNS